MRSLVILVVVFARFFACNCSFGGSLDMSEKAACGKEFTGKVIDVFPRQSALKSEIPSLQLEGVDGVKLLLSHQASLRQLEFTLSQFIDGMDEEELVGKEIKLEDIEVDGERIVFARTLNGHDVDDSLPAADELHRYIKVPIFYDKPELGTFELYCELNSDFDGSKPIVLIPSDPQQTGSWVGAADRNKKIFGIDYNVAVFQYRGSFGSAIKGLENKSGYDWHKVYEAFTWSTGVEDIERVRQELVGPEGKIYLAGGSGLATMAMLYLEKYHQFVERAFLMSFYVDAHVGSDGPDDFFRKFLHDRNLSATFDRALSNEKIKEKQLFHLLQRLLYSSQDRAQKLIEEVAQGKTTVYEEESEQHGQVDYFIGYVQRYWPQLVVFMYETNVPPKVARKDINEPFLLMGGPIAKLVQQGKLDAQYMNTGPLGKVSTDILFVAGEKDQVTPINVTQDIQKQVPKSRLAVMKGYHCLTDEPKLRAKMMNTFFAYGGHSKDFEALLHSAEFKDYFVRLED